MSWSEEEVKFLQNEMYAEHLGRLCSVLGRGVHSVQMKMKELENNKPSINNKASPNYKSDQLIPASEVLKRIRWDPALQPLMSDFFVYYKDRVQDVVMKAPFDAKNENIKGNERMFVFALPEHRIEWIRYKERTVWNKELRFDRVFGSMNGFGLTINSVLDSYDEYTDTLRNISSLKQDRVPLVLSNIRQYVTNDHFDQLQHLTNTVRKMDDTISKEKVESYVFRASDVLLGNSLDNHDEVDEINSFQSAFTATPSVSELDALNLLSDLVSLLPEEDIREPIINHIIENMKGISLTYENQEKVTKTLPDLNEDDLNEKFVRGSGPGGQKINKTASRVILVHLPTQLKVECQDTRSLQQNRKIARKRLRLKLDEFLNGSQSRVSQTAEKASKKKAKSKARNKARRKKKLESTANSNEKDIAGYD